jgi:hypothetical protein
MSPEGEAAADALNAETFGALPQGQLQRLLTLPQRCLRGVQHQKQGDLVRKRFCDEPTRRSIAADAAAKFAAQADLWSWVCFEEIKERQISDADRRPRGIWPYVASDIPRESWAELHIDQMRQAAHNSCVDAALQAMTAAGRKNWFKVGDALTASLIG